MTQRTLNAIRKIGTIAMNRTATKTLTVGAMSIRGVMR